MTLQVSAFQIDQTAILTLKNGEALITSGTFPVRELGSDNWALEVDFGDGVGWQRVTVTDRNEDPAKVGAPAREGQRRVYWAGTMDVED